MNDELPPAETETVPAVRPIRKTRQKFKPPATAPEDRRECKLVVSRALHIAIRMEAARLDRTIQTLLLDGLRRAFPNIAIVIEKELKEAERKRAA